MGRKDDIETIVTPGPEHLPWRRRPQLQSFVGLGALVGLVLGAWLAYLGPDAPGSTWLQEVILLGSIGAIFGGFAGSIAYLVADRVSLKD